jgi:cytochrome P450
MFKRLIRSTLEHLYLYRIQKYLEPEKITAEIKEQNEHAILTKLDPAHPLFICNPYPTLAYIRKFEPLHRSQTGAWVLTSYDDIVMALGDERFGNAPSEYALVHNRNRDKYVCANVVQNIIPFMDPPHHARPRVLLSRQFHRFLKDHPPAMEDIARKLLEELKNKNGADLLHDFSTPYALRVFSSMMGIPAEDEALLRSWSEDFFYLFTMIPSESIRQQVDRSLTDFRHYFANTLKRCRQQPSDSLIGYFAAADQDGKKLSEEEIIDNCMLIFADGIENVDKSIVSAWMLLQQHSDQLKLLIEKPKLLPQAVDECLRYESPAQYVGRVAREDIELYGQVIKKNEIILLMIAAANRDPDIFDQAESFDITRQNNPHISFGKSRHSCIGGPLVKQEMEAALSVMLPENGELGIMLDQLQWDFRAGHRWLKKCPLQ